MAETQYETKETGTGSQRGTRSREGEEKESKKGQKNGSSECGHKARWTNRELTKKDRKREIPCQLQRGAPNSPEREGKNTEGFPNGLKKESTVPGAV